MKYVFYRYCCEYTRSCATIGDGLEACYWMAELGEGAPQKILNYDGTIALQGEALHKAYWAWGDANDRQETAP